MIETFADRETLADAAANLLAERLAKGGLFVATGGSTPGPVYDRLARRDLPWDRITVTLTDERRVDPAAEESNERLLRGRLLVGLAAPARFLPLHDPKAAEALLSPHLPAAVTLMGMGPDGHVASLFPGKPELAEGMAGQRLVIPVAMSGQPPFVARITLTRRALLQTGLIVLAVTGDDKRALLERIAADPAYAPPAATFLRQTEVPVRTLWAT
ncbi:MAG: 6-phosphogluconolactonase [Caulobacteraceae bacterium]|jgi:6-phosphogluconolactonase